MKTFKSIFAIIILVIGLNSCSKNDETVSGPPPPPGLPEFLFAEGGATGFTAATDPIAMATSNEIFGRIGTAEIIKIKLSGFAVGVYTISAINQFTYTRPTTTSPWVAGTGNVVITASIGGKISGTFDLNSGTSTLGINEVHGQFSDVTIN